MQHLYPVATVGIQKKNKIKNTGTSLWQQERVVLIGHGRYHSCQVRCERSQLNWLLIGSEPPGGQQIPNQSVSI